jgi:hypothetical protein
MEGMGHRMNIKTAGPNSLYLAEMKPHMDFGTPPDYRAHATNAKAGVADHGDRYVLLFGLSGILVAFTMLLLN